MLRLCLSETSGFQNIVDRVVEGAPGTTRLFRFTKLTFIWFHMGMGQNPTRLMDICENSWYMCVCAKITQNLGVDPSPAVSRGDFLKMIGRGENDDWPWLTHVNSMKFGGILFSDKPISVQSFRPPHKDKKWVWSWRFAGQTYSRRSQDLAPGVSIWCAQTKELILRVAVGRRFVVPSPEFDLLPWWMISFGAHKFSQLLRHGLCSEISARHDPTQLKNISKISQMNVCGCVRAEQNNGSKCQSVYSAHIYGWLTVFVNEMEKLAKDCPVKCHSFSLCMRCKIDIAVAL